MQQTSQLRRSPSKGFGIHKSKHYTALKNVGNELHTHAAAQPVQISASSVAYGWSVDAGSIDGSRSQTRVSFALLGETCWSCVSHNTYFDASAVAFHSICHPLMVDHLPHLQVSYLMGFGGGLVTSLLIMVSNTGQKTLYSNVVPHDRVLRHSIIHQTPGFHSLIHRPVS